ncbi:MULTISPECIES: TolC family protein [unclassified Methylibium]|uniref:TolC family protein n=1 Tax=unclassified Methylibium TaxID=2633235 RepID=UPI0003F3E104|nr:MULTISPECIES: TolC family protein [unclassified Methylibium]EWS56605.1 type I secretion outer membrane protein, TolC family [Methylibium sp. T29]EWS61555.1 type I secretion outer membrane protein, TolC family [Methylibium sp. T29-B]MBQ1763612.1 TolC family protein [Aquincola sp.]|tara:strand:+ start:18413 stop:19654 length:1242 start_codon:yes stop_codon:yes gene_type:complete
MKRFVLAGIGALLIAGLAAAQEVATPKDLPPTVQAQAWIDKDPAVVEARRALDAAGHGAAVLAAGPHEWTANASTQRRNVGGVGNTTEWSVGVERGIRIGGKAGLDRQLGEVDIEIARARVSEARHEAARALSDLWLNWLEAHSAQALLKEQLSFAETNLAAVDKRKRAGDASALDLSIAQSDLAEVRRQASQADSTLAKAGAKLKLRFPEATLAPAALSDPAEPMWPEARWRERIVAEADPLKTAEGLVRRAELTASRTRADKVPDPTVGVFTSSEAFRNERVIGISVSIPFGGTVRERRLQQSLQEAEVARAALDRARQGIEIEIAETHADAVGGLERWRIAERGAEAARESARLTQRAYTLGEVDLQSLLLVRRQSLEALRAAGEARADALRWNYRLLIDAHLIWNHAND